MYRVLVGKHEQNRRLEDLSIDGRILKRILRKKIGWDSRYWTHLTQDTDKR
jgi:hypothetical protein